MALINRVTRLFRADMNAVLDQLEEPQAVLRQAIRDMEAQLDEADKMLRTKRREYQNLLTKRDDLGASLAEIDQHLDVCFESEEHDLARDLTRRKLETQRLQKRVQGRAQELEHELAAEDTTLDERKEVLAGLRQKAEIFAMDTKAAASRPSVPHTSGTELQVTASEVEAAFLSEMKRRAS